MGVQGLLPKLKSAMDQVNVAKYKGKTAGIDAAGWLYKGCYSCATDLVLGRDTDSYLNFSLQQIKLLEEHGIRPIFVFDGAPLPAKADENAVRFTERAVQRKKALKSLEGTGENNMTAFNKAVSVTNKMIMKFIAILRRMNIEFIVAPYEADAQLAFLSKSKLVDFVISEDSDCVPYGCRTTLFKWSGDGWASELKRRSLGANEELSFVGWSDDMFVQLCVLCGCDYCPSVPGVGIITAYKIVNQHKNPSEVITAIQEQKKGVLPPDFKKSFIRAILTFRHHLVFDPRDQKLKMLNPLSLSGTLPEEVDNELQFLGNLELTDAIVASVAQGLIHPATHESYAWSETVISTLGSVSEEDAADSLTSSETSSTADRRRRLNQIISSRDALGDVSSTGEESVRRTGAVPKSGQSSWRHLDGVLGTSPHILNFSSPKVSDNFQSLVSLTSKHQVLQSTTTTDELSSIRNATNRPLTKRPRNPRNRVREDQRSGFTGEVSCHVNANEPVAYKRRRQAQEQEPIQLRQQASIPLRDQASYTSSPLRSHASSPVSSVSSNYADRDVADGVHSGATFDSRPNVFNAVAARRATTVEEKWDRILQEAGDSGSDEEGDQASNEDSSSVAETRSFTSSFRSMISKGIPSFSNHA